jgi:hypothetical protein
VDHRPLRHKYRGVWGGALVPGFFALSFYAYVVLSAWNGYDQRAATGRHLLAEQLAPKNHVHFASKNHVHSDATNATAEHSTRRKTALDELSQSTETLATATFALGIFNGVMSLVLVCLLWRRVSQLQDILQAEGLLRV